MSERGRYVMTRGWQDHPFFKAEPFTEREAWEWLIGEAAFEDTRVRINRAVFEVRRGQLVHALRFLAAKWDWSEARVRRFLLRLRNEHMIDALASSEATLITICNYDEYQFVRRTGDAQIDEPATHSRRREEELQEINKPLGGGTTRAREADCTLISKAAMDFSFELAKICGHDPDFLPLRWISASPAVRVQTMLDAGYQIPVMRDLAKAVMRKKRDGPPDSILYFEKIFARAHAPQPPLHAVQEPTHEPAKTASHHPATSWQESRDRWRAAHAKLEASIAADKADEGEGGVVVPLTPAAGRGGA